MTKNIVFKGLVLLFVTLAPMTAFAFDLMELSDTDEDVYGIAQVSKGWESHGIDYNIISGVEPPGVTSEQWLVAVTNAFDSWTNVDGCEMNLIYAGELTLTDSDDLNSYFTFRVPDEGTGPPADTGTARIVTCLTDWTAAGFSSDALAVTAVFHYPSTRYIAHADMFFNTDPASNITWASGAVTDAYDVESVVAHEAGHFIGIGHPYDAGRETSTMWWQGTPGSTEAASLEQDDMNAAIYLYPTDITSVTTPDNIYPDNNKWGLRDTFTGEWTDTSPDNDPNNDPYIASGGGGGGGCSVSSGPVPWQSFFIPYLILFGTLFFIRRCRLIRFHAKNSL